MADSCLDCPSYLAADDTEIRDRFSKAIGAPVCARYGIVLGTANSSPEELKQIAIKTSNNCDSYGKPRPDKPVSVEMDVATPVQITPRTGGDPMVKACFKCKHQVTQDAVYQKFGWATALCEAKGSLILKPVLEAKGCTFAESGPGWDTADHIEVKPLYESGFRVPDEEAIKAFVDLDATSVDPSQYPTDRTVTPEDDAAGIRAWREVKDPTGNTESIYLPIFKLEAIPEEHRNLIPKTGSQGHPELYVDYNGLLWQFCCEGLPREMGGLEETPVFIGEPGTGKTQFARWLAWLCQMPFIRLQFQHDMDPTDMLGTKEVSPERGTFFEPGPLPVAWTSIAVTLSDEPNVGPDAVWQVYRPLTDNSKELRIENEVFPRHQFCFHLMAMNPSHDMRNIGTNELADADSNRLSFLLVERAPEPIERHIVRTYCKVLDGYDISDETLDVLMNVSKDIQAASKAHNYPGSWATRQQIKVARKTRRFGIVEAYKIATLNQLEPSVADLVLQSIASHTGISVKLSTDEDDEPDDLPFPRR